MRLSKSLLIPLLLLCLAGSVFAAKASRIVLKDGTFYQDVNYSVDNTYKVIYVVVDQQEKTLSFTNIAGIYDDDGEDVTADVLGDYYRPGTTPTPPPPEGSTGDATVSPSISPASQGDEEQETPAWKKKVNPFVFGFSPGVHTTFASGDWYEGTKSEAGFHAYVLIPVDRRVALRLSVSKAGIDVDKDEFFRGYTVIQENVSFNVWRYFVSAEYFNWPEWRKGGKVMSYCYGGLGAISHNTSGEAYVYSPYEDVVYYLTGTDGQTKFATTLGGGIVVCPGRNIGLDLGGQIDCVFVGSGQEYGSTQTAFLIDLKLGISIFIQ